MYRLGNFCIFLAAFPLLAALWAEGAVFLSSLPNPRSLLWFGIGMGGMLLLCILLRGTTLHFNEVATHEMAHAWTGLMFLGEADMIRVEGRNTPESSSGETDWGLRNREIFLVSIAPYSFPLLAIPPLVLKLLPFGQTPPASLVIDVVLGAALAFNYHYIWNDFGVVQTDLTRVCTPVGFVSAMTFQLIFLVIALSAVMGSPQLIGSYFWAAGVRALDYYKIMFEVLSQAWAAATG